MRGYHLSQLLIGVLGALFVTGEYGTGMIRSTFAAVPRRLPVLGAKTAVLGVVALVTMVAASFAGFFGADALLSGYHHTLSLSEPGALRVVAGTGVYLALIGQGFMGRAHSNAYRRVNNFFDLKHQPVLKAVCARSAGRGCQRLL